MLTVISECHGDHWPEVLRFHQPRRPGRVHGRPSTTASPARDRLARTTRDRRPSQLPAKPSSVAVQLRLLATDHHLVVPAPAPQRARARAARRDRTQPPHWRPQIKQWGLPKAEQHKVTKTAKPGRVAGWVPSTGPILKALRSVGRPQEIGTHREAGVHLAPCPTHPEPAPWNNCGVGKGPVRSGVSWHDPSALPTWL